MYRGAAEADTMYRGQHRRRTDA